MNGILIVCISRSGYLRMSNYGCVRSYSGSIAQPSSLNILSIYKISTRVFINFLLTSSPTMVWGEVSPSAQLMGFPREREVKIAKREPHTTHRHRSKFKKAQAKFIIILLCELTRLLSKEALEVSP